MATGDITGRVSLLGTARGQVDLTDILALLRAIRDQVQATDRKVDRLMTEMGNAQTQIAAMAAQLEALSKRQDVVAGILRDFVATHSGGDTFDPALLAPIQTAIGHLEGTTENIEGIVPDQPPA